jgi:hypothetical protein
LDPLIKSQLLYQLSYAPKPKEFRGLGYSAESRGIILGTGIEAACRGYSSGSPMRQGCGSACGFGGSWRKADRTSASYSNRAHSITDSDSARCGLACSAQIARTDSRHEPMGQLYEDPASFDPLHNAGRAPSATYPRDFVALAETGRQFRLQPDASSLDFACYGF